ncbi:MAG: LCP family protein [Clostridia bacterium]|nr:LCP family protein [Clostridia bacterium]
MNENQKKPFADPQKRQKREYILWGVLAAAIVLILTVALVVIFYAPNVDDTPHFPTDTPNPDQTDDTNHTGTSAEPYQRKDGFYTFLVAGMDAASNNTDVLMLASLDTKNGEIHIVQIPRDTYVNKTVGGYTTLTRVNAIFSAEYNYQVSRGISKKTAKTLAMEDLCKRLSEALCINIDEYVYVNTSGFRNIIDAVGGIDYEVPQDMFYEDPFQNLYIDLKAGYQHLNGTQCEHLIRYRSGYVTGDIGRVELRSDFMVEVFRQVKNKIDLDSMLALIRDKDLMQKVGTSMSLMDIFAYVKMVYKLDDDAISVRTISGEVVQNPNTGAWIYYCLNKKSALNDINECLNVYEKDIDISLFDSKGLFSGTEGADDHYIYEYYNS